MNKFLQGFLIGVGIILGLVLLGYLIINGVNFLFALFGKLWGMIASMAVTAGLILGIALQSTEY